ncbi:hypothetical protein KJ951_00540 [Patescibacteria group bacterium]|nr:hypothetical protein [Patescibacteria group bacterium]MBU1702869.1 hypothetical protein [Patescibacteria group bacterium]MBU1953374.1 hypothetical protein [Patescibacteria group bacterium]
MKGHSTIYPAIAPPPPEKNQATPQKLADIMIESLEEGIETRLIDRKDIITTLQQIRDLRDLHGKNPVISTIDLAIGAFAEDSIDYFTLEECFRTALSIIQMHFQNRPSISQVMEISEDYANQARRTAKIDEIRTATKKK